MDGASFKRHAAGKSWSRLVDDLLRYTPGSGFLGLAPFDATSVVSTKVVNKLAFVQQDDVATQERVDEVATKYHLMFTNTGFHLDVTIRTTLPMADHDFHLTHQVLDGRHEYYKYESSPTDTIVEFEIQPPELGVDIRTYFELAAVQERHNKYKGLKEPAPAMSVTESWKTLYNIVTTVLVRNARKPIAVDNPKLLIRIEPSVLVDKLGYTVDSDLQSYVPPALAPELEGLYRRVALECAVMASTNVNGAWRPAVGELKHALPHPDSSANQIGSDMPNIGQESYGCFVALGACEYFSSQLVIQRFEAQEKNDPERQMIYFEALTRITEQQRADDEELQMRVVSMVGTKVTFSQTKDAYRTLGIFIEPNDESFDHDHSVMKAYQENIQRDPGNKSLLDSVKTIALSRPQSSPLHKFVTVQDMDLNMAFSTLDVTSETDDDSIKALTEFKMAQVEEDEAELVLNAVLVIAKERLSDKLLLLYENMLGNFEEPRDMSPESAYSLLGCDSSMDTASIIALYQMRVKEDKDQILQLRTALRSIATDKQSNEIRQCLGEGDVLFDAVKITKPMGLGNIGNTCYLNSLLQYYYSITPLREKVKHFDTSDDQEDPAALATQGVVKKIGGREVQSFEVERSQMFISALGRLYNEMSQLNKSYVIPEKALAYMALVPPHQDQDDFQTYLRAKDAYEEYQKHQELEEEKEREQGQYTKMDEDARENDIIGLSSNNTSDETPSLIDMDETPAATPSVDGTDTGETSSKMDVAPVTSAHGEAEAPPSYVESEPHLNDANMDLDSNEGQPPPPLPARPAPPPPAKYPPSEKVSVAFSQAGQQDVTECIDNVLFQLEAGLKVEHTDENGEQQDLITRLFYGKVKEKLADADGSNQRDRSTNSGTIMLHLNEDTVDVYDGMDQVFNENVVENSSGEKVIKRDIIEHLPEILQFQVQRVYYDFTKQQVAKNTQHIAFPEVIYMDRYLETDDAKEDELRKQGLAWKNELRELKKKVVTMNESEVRGMSLPDVLRATMTWLEKQTDEKFQVPQETLQAVDQEIERLEAAALAVEARISELQELLQDLYSKMQKVAYRVHAVFIHRGTASQGHYWVYIHDFKQNCFRKYNDEQVTEVNADEVFSTDTAASAPTPYFVTYVRDDLVADYVDPMGKDIAANDENDDNAKMTVD